MITYCTNIHPGESWQDIFGAVRRHAPVVREQVAPESTFPLGLRLSGRAALEMTEQDAADFSSWCSEKGFQIRTINGFPYGAFHHVPVKESVYLPDWRFAGRLDYTNKLARLLSGWLPEGKTGSISTVPIGYRTSIDRDDFPVVQKNVRAALDYLDHLSQQTGKEILLSMEPEPGCFIETTPEVIDIFSRLELSPEQQSRLAVCFDCCHQALQYENPAESLQLLAEYNIRIGHVQVSSALQLVHPDIGRLARFRESCYLHQTVGMREDGVLLRYPDLEEAIAEAPAGVEEWRVHFHVPVFLDRTSECSSTRFFLEEILPLFPAGTPMEVETYTWTVLPPELRKGSVTDSIVREINWVQNYR